VNNEAGIIQAVACAPAISQANASANTQFMKVTMSTSYEKGVDDDFIDERPSKTRRKKDMHALQDIGADLVALSKDRLKQVPLDEDLRTAVELAQKINSHEGKRRQMQYIGKLMRTRDAAPIQTLLDMWSGESKAATAQLHLLERWRERLLESDEALTEFASEYPQAELQELRTCIRNARKEKENNKPPKAFREIFQHLKQWL
jgi:ribosome-associated protein